MRSVATKAALVVIFAAALIVLPSAAQEASTSSWRQTDFGPAFSGPIEVGPGHFASKGMVICTDPEKGGVAQGSLFVAYDTDTLRCVAGWSGDGLDGVGPVMNGESQIPSVTGSLLFENPDRPGWAIESAAGFEDSRLVVADGTRSGPIDPAHGKWRGYSRSDDRVVLSYVVHGVDVLESPDSAIVDGAPVLVRHFEVGPRRETLLLQVARDASGAVQVTDDGVVCFRSPGRRGESRSANRDEEEDEEDFEDEDFDDEDEDLEDEDFEEEDEDLEDEDFEEEDEDFDAGDDFDEDDPLYFEGDVSLRVSDSEAFDLTQRDYTVVARVRTEEGGTIFAQSPLEGGYAPDSKSLFIADGVLQFDIGWVEAIRSETEIDDGRWHVVAVVFDADEGEATLYVDGEEEANAPMEPTRPVEQDQVLRIGFTAPDFPDDVRGFEGEIPQIAFYQRRLSPEELDAYADGKAPSERLIAHWDRFDHDEDRFLDTVGGHNARWEDVELEDFEEEEDFDEEDFEEEEYEEFDDARRLEFNGDSIRVRVDGIRVEDTQQGSYSLVARIKTTTGGPLFAVTDREGAYRENNVCWFIREGRLVFDMGFVGQAEGQKQVADGEWHTVAMSYDAETGQVQMYVDGREDRTTSSGDGQAGGLIPLDSGDEPGDTCAWIGYASKEFPEEAPRYFEGQIAKLRVYSGLLDGEQGEHLLGLSPAETLGEVAAWRPLFYVDGAVDDQSDNGRDGVVLGVEGGSESEFFLTACTTIGDLAAPDWLVADDGDVLLQIPAGIETLRFAIAYAPVENREDADLAAEGVQQSVPGADDLRAMRGLGAPAPRGTYGAGVVVRSEEGAGFLVEEILPPNENPHDSRLLMSALDFFNEGESAAVATLDGEVWIVDGVGRLGEAELRWRRIAAGLSELHGLSVVDGSIYTLGRNEITRLIDHNGDGSIDRYECFSNDMLALPQASDATVGLTPVSGGGFVYARGGPRDGASVTPHQGALLRVAGPDSPTEVVANGFANPSGVCSSEDGRWWVVDRDGRGAPKGRLALASPGDFFGADGASPIAAGVRKTEPVAWMHGDMVKAPAAVLQLEAPSWPELDRRLLVLSAIGEDVQVALHEGRDGSAQSAMYKLPLGPLSRSMEFAKFHRESDTLYLCGSRDPSTGKPIGGRVYRVSRTGAPRPMPLSVRATTVGLEVTFSGPLDAKSAGDWRNYSASRWGYRLDQGFGSDDYRVSDSRRKGRDRLLVSGVTVSADRRTVSLKLAGMRPAPGNELKCDLRAADGSPVQFSLHFTTRELDVPARVATRPPRFQP